MPVEVVTYRPEYADDFARLNLVWIEEHFRVEDEDRRQLSQPYQNIVGPGGEIFFIVEDGVVLGTCGVEKVGEKVFDLVKMAVDGGAQGKGLANLIMQAAINWAKDHGVEKLCLQSNTKLVPAIRLYRKFGFVEVPLPEHAEYERANIAMELKL